ncbi:MAG: hypothetical protein ACE5JK_04265 [Candidatus Omnitrophota bacterium]
MPSDAGKKAAREARERATRYRKALEYLDGCTQFTFKELEETNRIAGSAISQPELREMWEMSQKTFEGGESCRKILYDTLIEGIDVLESLAEKIENQ